MTMKREPIVAGQFYPADPGILEREVRGYLSQADVSETAEGRTLLAMVPHAGYMFSGGVCGRTLGEARLPRTIVLLGPNHTGLGERMAVWGQGQWELPGGGVPIAESLAQSMVAKVPGCTFDPLAHKREHSLEVVLPFLRCLHPEIQVVPVAVSEPSPESLVSAGRVLGELLAAWEEPVSLVVSSDMSHYVSEKRAHELDRMAIDALRSLEPGLLYETVRRERITMCGVLPMTMGLAAVTTMGAKSARLVSYATSAEVTQDVEQVVGYAGILMD